MSLKRIDAIFFDVGGVLFEIDWRRTLIHLGITNPLTQLHLSEKFTAWETHNDYERGHLGDDEFLEACLEFFSEDLTNDNVDLNHMREAWHELVLHPVQGIESVLGKLTSAPPIYTLSNTNTLHFNEYSKHSLFNGFEKLYTSFNLHERKPDLAIYEKAADAVRVAPENCLFIDDLEENVEAARKVGFNAERSKNSSPRTAEILKNYRVLK